MPTKTQVRSRARGANPDVRSRRGKRKGKTTYVSEYDIAKAKKGTPFVMYDDGRNEQTVFIVNPLNVEAKGNEVIVYQFGAVGTIWLAVLNEGFESGLEEAAGWLADHAPGHLMEFGSAEYRDLYDEALKELVKDGEDPEDEETQSKADQNATEDLTYTESGYLTSYEWWGGEASDDLARLVVNKAKDRYSKQYGEMPNPSRRGNPKAKAKNPKEKNPRQNWKKGDRLTVRPTGSGLRKSGPAANWIDKKRTVTALEEGRIGGWDVYDVDAGDGEDRSIYGWSVTRVDRAKTKNPKATATRAKNPKGKHVACGRELTAKQCRQLQDVYVSARERGFSKQRAAKQAWGAVDRTSRKNNGAGLGAFGPVLAALGGYLGGKPSKRRRNPEAELSSAAARLAAGMSR